MPVRKTSAKQLTGKVELPRFIKVDAKGNAIKTGKHIAFVETASCLMFTHSLGEKNQSDALELAKSCRLLGFEDWALQTVHQGFLLVDHTKIAPAVDKSVVIDGHGWNWTSTDHASSSDLAWGVYLDHGNVYCDRRYDTGFVRACRLVPASQFTRLLASFRSAK